MEITALIAIFAALLLLGFFAGVESAFISANKLTIELNRKQGTYSGKIWGNFATSPTKFICTFLLVSNLLLVIYGMLVGALFTPLWSWLEHRLTNLSADNLSYIKLLVQFVLATLMLLLTKFFFKAFFRARSSSILSNGFISYLVSIFYSIFSGLANFFQKACEWMLQYIFNVKLNEKKEMFSRVDLEQYVQQNKNSGETDHVDLNKELFENALSLGDTKLRECLVPRKEIVAVDRSMPIADLKNKFVSTRLSKLVVYDGSIDNIVGYTHQLGLFRNPATIEDILLPIPRVPESMSATNLMNKFSAERKSIAWVIDEFGGTAGIVTMEDLLEEIFGDIKDEYDDVDEFIEKQIAESEYIFSGRLKLDHIENKYGLLFPGDGDAETLSGYIIQEHETIPKAKQRIIIGKYAFDILSVSDTRIETVKLRVLS